MSKSACVVVAIMFDVIVNFKIVLFSFLTSFEFAIDRPSIIVLSILLIRTISVFELNSKFQISNFKFTEKKTFNTLNLIIS